MVGWLVPLDPAHSIPAEASTNCFVGAGQKLSPTFLKHLKGCYQSLWAFECYWDINSYFNHFFYESFPLSSQLLSDSAPNSIFRTPVDFVPCWLILLPQLHSEIRAGAQCTDTMWPGLCPPPQPPHFLIPCPSSRCAGITGQISVPRVLQILPHLRRLSLCLGPSSHHPALPEAACFSNQCRRLFGEPSGDCPSSCLYPLSSFPVHILQNLSLREFTEILASVSPTGL